MRITTQIAASGIAGLSRIVTAKATLDECLTPRGSLDVSKAFDALNVEGIQMSSKDGPSILAFALEYLRQQEAVVRHMSEAAKNSSKVHLRPTSKDDERLERNMSKGRVAYVRLDITHCRNGLHCKVSVMNPRGTIGNAWPLAQDFAVIVARVLLYLKRSIDATPIVVIEGEGAAGLIAQAEAEERQVECERLRESCDRLHNGYCTPCKFDCPLFCNGKCKDPAKEELNA